MSSNIVHVLRGTEAEPSKHPLLLAIGERVRARRNRRGMTRRGLAEAADISERHLANLEYGVGNASILVLAQVAQALHCPLVELIGDPVDADGASAARATRIALIGLRGAGKSTLGKMLADDLGVAFVELSREIERLAGASIAELQALYGQTGYRRYERRALEETIERHPEAVIAIPGGLVSDSASLNALLTHCTTIWLEATPEDHLKRVIAQGDMRPMATSKEAMEDLKGILADRAPFYSKADHRLMTSGRALREAFNALRRLARDNTHRTQRRTAQ